MEDKHMVKVINQMGEEKEVEILLLFKLEDTALEYIVYTMGEIDTNNLVKIYASVFTKQGDNYILEDIKTDKEWTKIKDIMRDVINANKE